jgi:hypothetical protein
VERWLHGRPSGQNAWLLGEGLHWSDEATPALMPSASGMLMLWWAGHLKHIVGVLGCTQTAPLKAFETHIWAMFATMMATLYAPLDELTIREQRRDYDESTSVVARHGGFNLRNARRAMKVWTLPTELRSLLNEGAGRWFDRLHHKPNDKFPHRLRAAYYIAESNIQREIAVDLVRDHLAQWFYTEVMPEPPPETVEMWAELLEDPSSATSRAILSGLRSAALLRRSEG